MKEMEPAEEAIANYKEMNEENIKGLQEREATTGSLRAVKEKTQARYKEVKEK